MLIAHGVVRLHCGRRPYQIELYNGQKVTARTIVIATGNPYTLTNSTNGTVTLNASLSSADGTSRTFTIQGNAETVITGNLLNNASAARTSTPQPVHRHYSGMA